MLPEIRDTATGYEVAFSEDDGARPYVTFRAEHVEQMTWGLLATVQVSSPLAQGMRLPNDTILIDRINLLRSRDLRETAMRIDQKLPPPTSARRQDWQAHLETLAAVVYERTGKAVDNVDLRRVPLPGRQRFLIPGLLASDKTNILYGPGGTGKSVLALRMAVSIVSGEDFLGWEIDQPGNVLYLDWEDDSDTMVTRLDAVCEGMGIERVPFIYKSLAGRGSYERHHADVKAYVEANPTSLVVFDSTAMAMHGSSQGDGADGAIKFMSLVSQLPTTRLLIDHVASDDMKKDDKAKKSGIPKPYGSVFKANSARNMWEITRWNEANFSGVTLYHRKSNVGPRMENLDIVVKWSKAGVTFDLL